MCKIAFLHHIHNQIVNLFYGILANKGILALQANGNARLCIRRKVWKFSWEMHICGIFRAKTYNYNFRSSVDFLKLAF